jgi:adenosylmethionine-8-amino-7-oxononanoate aminotransferase
MGSLIVLGSDTASGKTTFALLWLAAFGQEYQYWKPVETGDPDSGAVARLVSCAAVRPALASFTEAVAPGLAARRAGRPAPTVAGILAARPQPAAGQHLLVETFGSPLSPLNDQELQIQMIVRLGLPSVLVIASRVGAVGQALQSLAGMSEHGLTPVALVLIGPHDPYAEDQIGRHGNQTSVFGLHGPASYDRAAISHCAEAQRATLAAIRARVQAVQSTSPRPDLRELLERDRAHVWHPYTALRDPDAPLVVVDAQQEFLRLADGRQIIDGISSWWTILHGHRHPVLMRALQEASRHYDHVHFAGVTHPMAVELAERLLATLPWDGGRVFFSDDGSTAVEVALKMAYQYWCERDEPQRTCFVGFEHGYHGDTFGAMAVGRDPVFFARFEPLLFQAERVPVCAERLDDCLCRLRGQVSAVIIEPLVQGAGGMRMHGVAVLRAIYEVARAHGVLFIADEVMTGGGRTGRLWAHQTAGIAPDLLCAGKTLAGGVLPIAATLVAPHIAASWDTADRSRTFFHGHSFTAHPLACAVAVANWGMLREGPGSVPAAMERFWESRLSCLRGQDGVTDVRVCGSIAAIELDHAGGYLADVGRRMHRVCLEHGVLLRPLGNVLYSMPPFCTAPQSLEQIARAMMLAVATAG